MKLHYIFYLGMNTQECFALSFTYFELLFIASYSVFAVKCIYKKKHCKKLQQMSSSLKKKKRN